MAKDEMTQQVEQDTRLDRYVRQMSFKPIGEQGQLKLLDSRVVIIGCGALGSVQAGVLARAGVGFLRLVDRDYLELNNLQRQTLFDEDDVAANIPKAEAARRKLKRINSDVEVEAVITDVNPRNIERLVEGVDVILDGSDNFETRFLINDVAVKANRPWLFGACAGAVGMSMPIVPEDTPCLRCVFEQGPPPELCPTAESDGILASTVNIVASHQAMEAMKILMGCTDALDRKLLHFDAWTGQIRQINVQNAYEQGECPCCKGKSFEYLNGKSGDMDATPCGRNAVQITPKSETQVNFSTLAEKIKAATGTEPQFSDFLLKAAISPFDLVVFADGRAIVKGTNQPKEARAIYDKYMTT